MSARRIPSIPSIPRLRTLLQRLAPAPCVLLLAPAGVLFSSAAAAQSADAADAVSAARATALPAWRDTASRSSEALSGFGGGSLSATPVADRERLWAKGAGSLAGPGEERAIGCRSASDPECLAVQVLDKGFPERPAVPDDMLAGRDAVIEAAKGGSGGSSGGSLSGAASCRDFTLSIPAIRREEICAAGPAFVERSCLAGWTVSAAQTLSRWACEREAARVKRLACSVAGAFTTTLETRVACRFDGSALLPKREERVETSASASAAFPATCRAPQKSVRTVTCSETLTVSGAPSCAAGEVAESTGSGSAGLLSDACPGFDALTLRHKCARETDGRRAILFRVSGVSSWGTIRGVARSSVTKGACSATVAVTSHDCTKSDAGLACVAKATATVRTGGTVLGTIHATLAYTGWSEGGGLVDAWDDGCKAVKEAS